MVATYCLKGIGIPMTASQSLMHIFNATGSAKIIKVYRVWLSNCQATAVTGSQNIIQLQRITSVTAVTNNLEPTPYDSTNATAILQRMVATAVSTNVTSWNFDPTVDLASYTGQPVWCNNVTVPTTTLSSNTNSTTFVISAAGTAMASGISQVPMQFGYINAGSKATVTVDAAGIFRRMCWSSDEPTIQVGDIDSLENNSMWMMLWDCGYNDANIEPIVLRAGYGLSIQNNGMAVGTVDCFMELTIE